MSVPVPDAATFARVLTRALGAGEYADAFYERRTTRTFRFQDGRVHEAGIAIACGVGIRVLSGERAGYAYTDDLGLDALLATARTASLVARDATARAREIAMPARATAASGDAYGRDATGAVPTSATYVDLLARADVAARAADARVSAVNVTVSDDLQDVAIVTSDGRFVTDRRPLVTFGVQCVAAGTVRGSGFAGDGGRTTLAEFLTRDSPEAIAREAARIAGVNCDARETPAGVFDVVVGAGSGGVLLHEAVGHGLEGDFNARGRRCTAAGSASAWRASS